MSTSWKAQSRISCIRECNSRFRENCTEIIFNTETRACTPVQSALSGNLTLDPVPGDVLSYRARDLYTGQIPGCDTAAGFQLYENGNMAVCYLICPESDTYLSAQTYCLERNSRLFIANTAEKVSLFKSLVGEYFNISSWTHIGLIKHNHSWEWQNGEALDLNTGFEWGNGQPDFNPDEDCGMYVNSDFNFHNSLCSFKNDFICEKVL